MVRARTFNSALDGFKIKLPLIWMCIERKKKHTTKSFFGTMILWNIYLVICFVLCCVANVLTCNVEFGTLFWHRDTVTCTVQKLRVQRIIHFENSCEENLIMMKVGFEGANGANEKSIIHFEHFKSRLTDCYRFKLITIQWCCQAVSEIDLLFVIWCK